MAHSSAVPRPGPEFDDFLFAPVGEDGNGMLLSVLSALARLNVDPWQEAANLARLPVKTATQQLASLIAKLPDGPSARPDPATIAARLIALLPRWAGSRAAPRETPRPAGLVTKPRALLFVALMVLVLAAHYFMDARRAPGEDEDFRAPVSGTVLPQSRSGP
jgi:hypothetical protein